MAKVKQRMAELIHVKTTPPLLRAVQILVILALAIPAAVPFAVQGSSIFKCSKGDKIVFSQTSCPQEYRQHKLEYEFGVTTITDSDKKPDSLEPMLSLFNNKTINKTKLLKLISSEIYRLKQESSYYGILKSSALRKIERKRYWQKKADDDPKYLEEIKTIENYFDDLIAHDQASIEELSKHKALVEAKIPPEDDQ